MNRRSFLKTSGQAAGGLAAADFLSYFLSDGHSSLSLALTGAVKDHAKEAVEPRFLIYWFMEGAPG